MLADFDSLNENTERDSSHQLSRDIWYYSLRDTWFISLQNDTETTHVSSLNQFILI